MGPTLESWWRATPYSLQVWLEAGCTYNHWVLYHWAILAQVFSHISLFSPLRSKNVYLLVMSSSSPIAGFTQTRLSALKATDRKSMCYSLLNRSSGFLCRRYYLLLLLFNLKMSILINVMVSITQNSEF